MRRLLRNVAEDESLGDTTTLADPSVVEGIKARYLVDQPRRRRVRGSPPEHWTWRDGPVEPGPAVVVDIDGVLSDAATRQHYLEAPRRDWQAFFEACGDDPVIEEMRVLLDLLEPGIRVVLLTARPGPGPPPHRGVARPLRDPLGPAHHAAVGRLRPVPGLQAVDRSGTSGDYGFDLRLGIEDDRRNVEMLRSEGIPCIYFHSGYYD